MKDTDGDGVMDFYDKQLITPTECQPVNADGFGKCPTRNDFVNSYISEKYRSFYTSLTFVNKSSILTNQHKKYLLDFASNFRANPSLPARITYAITSDAKLTGLIKKRVNLILDYLVKVQNFDKDRFILNPKNGFPINEISFAD